MPASRDGPVGARPGGSDERHSREARGKPVSAIKCRRVRPLQRGADRFVLSVRSTVQAAGEIRWYREAALRPYDEFIGAGRFLHIPLR